MIPDSEKSKKQAKSFDLPEYLRKITLFKSLIHYFFFQYYCKNNFIKFRGM